MRKYAITAAVAVAAAGLTVGLTLATRNDGAEAGQGAGRAAAAGARPRRAHRSGGGRAAQGRRSLRRRARCARRRRSSRATARREAAVGSALASWPSGFDRLAALAARDRRSSLVQLQLRARPLLARRHAGREGGLAPGPPGAAGHARTPSARRTSSTRDSRAACRRSSRASCRRPALAKLSPPRQLAYLARARDRRSRPPPARRRLPAARAAALGAARVRARLRARRPRSPRRGRPLRQGRSLADVLPARPAREAAIRSSQSVRFHLGLCLLWLGTSTRRSSSFASPATAGPRTPLGIEARRFLERLA